MSSVRSVLCGRTLLRSQQLTRQLATTVTSVSSNSHQVFDVNCSSKNNKNSNNYGMMHHSGKFLLSQKSVLVSSRSSYTTALSNMTKDQANELVFRLNDSERQILLQVLNQFESNKERKRLEVDSTPPPSTNDLTKLIIINSLPFIGFGFLDNFTMIIAGDYIEHSIAGVITISTMAAAALGNTISDVLGIGSAYYVERIAEKVGIRPPELTPIQLEMGACRRASNIGRVLGITIGCLLGMCPLLFMKGVDEKDEKATDVSVSANLEETEIVVEAKT